MPPDLHLQIVDRGRAGAKPFDLSFELGVYPGTINKLTLHLPHGDKRDFVRASILERVVGGQDVRAIASLESCSIGFVLRVLNAYGRELDACERLSKMKAPKQKTAKPVH